MAACDQVTKYIQRVMGTGSGGAVAITFPTSTIPKTQGTNTQVSVANATSTVVLSANPSRRFAQIINVSGSTFFLAFGAAASASSLPIPNNSVFTIDINTIGEINRQDVRAFQNSGAPLNISVYEE